MRIIKPPLYKLGKRDLMKIKELPICGLCTDCTQRCKQTVAVEVAYCPNYKEKKCLTN